MGAGAGSRAQLGKDGHAMKDDEEMGLTDPSGGQAHGQTHMVARGHAGPRYGGREQNHDTVLDLLKWQEMDRGDDKCRVESWKWDRSRARSGNKARGQTQGRGQSSCSACRVGGSLNSPTFSQASGLGGGCSYQGDWIGRSGLCEGGESGRAGSEIAQVGENLIYSVWSCTSPVKAP